MTYTADPRVDAFIGALPEWQQAICRKVRDLVHAADPEVTETIKRTGKEQSIISDIPYMVSKKRRVEQIAELGHDI